MVRFLTNVGLQLKQLFESHLISSHRGILVSNSKPSLIILILLIAISPFSDTMFTPSMPAIAHGFGVSYSSIQNTITFYLFGFAIGQLLYGPFSDRFGRRAPLIIGLAIFVLSSLCCALSTNEHMLIFFRFFQSAGSCAGGVISRAIMMDIYSGDERRKRIPFISASIALAPAIAPAMGGVIVMWFGWRYNFYFLVAMGLALLILVLLKVKETNNNLNMEALKLKPLVRNYGRLIKSRPFMTYATINGCVQATLYAYAAESPFLYINLLHLTPRIAGLLSVFNVLGFMVGIVLVGYLLKYINRDKMLFFGLCFSLLGVGSMCYFLLYADAVNVMTILIPINIFMAGFAMVTNSCTEGGLAIFDKTQIKGYAAAFLGFLPVFLAGFGSILMHRVHNGTFKPMPILLLSIISLGFVIYVVSFLIFPKSNEINVS